MSSVNERGYGAPFYVIKLSNGEQLQPNNIVAFQYTHSEDKDDKCILEIQTADIDLIDSPQLQERSRLEISWGYISGERSKVFPVYISEVKARFTPRILILTIECVDKYASTAKQNSRKNLYSDTTLDEVAQDVANRNGLDYVNEVINVGEREPLRFQQGIITSQIDNTAVPREFRNYQDYPQANKSDGHMLRDMVEQEPGGPYVVEGHGDELKVKKEIYLSLLLKPLNGKED